MRGVTVDSKYAYVSYTRPDPTTSVTSLVEATRGWQPIRGKILEQFDFPGFLARYAVPRPRPRGPGSTGDAVLDVLAQPDSMRGPAEFVRGHPGITDKIARCMAAGEPLQVVIPSFPGRPFNPLTHHRVQPDLGEAYAFVLLHRIALEVAAVYEPGIRFVILLDGQVYNPFYGFTVEAEHQYPRDLQAIVDALGVRDTVSFVDLQDLVDERGDEFAAVHAEVVPEIESRWGDEVNPLRDELVETMRLGTNTSAVNAAAIQLVKGGESGSDPGEAAELIAAMRAAVQVRARATAFAYMTFLVTLKRMDLIGSAFPAAVRGTVHPKPGQYSPLLVHPTTTIAPWHGVSVARADGVVNTVYEAKIYERHADYTAVFLSGEYTPFYYEERPNR